MNPAPSKNSSFLKIREGVGMNKKEGVG